VEERKPEVAMLGAIGLSPRQISFLLMSESTVFSVLGIVFGLLAGLAFAMITGRLQVLQSLDVNFTSMNSTLGAMSAGVIVLLATIIPALKAAALAAPSGMAAWALPAPRADGAIAFSLPFTLTRGNAVGMLSFFRQFLLNHADSTSEGFSCRNVCAGQAEVGAVCDLPGSSPVAAVPPAAGGALQLTCDMWLAPYDLDVAQQLTMQVRPTEHAGVFGVDIHLLRASGTEEAWLRTNYGFMNMVRRQFLIWRNLDNDMRRRYVEEGARLLTSGR
jgi:hypothetical protein